MEHQKLLETLADIAYMAGENRYFTGDSRADVNEFILWAREFEAHHRDTDWNREDYILSVREFVEGKLSAYHSIA